MNTNNSLAFPYENVHIYSVHFLNLHTREVWLSYSNGEVKDTLEIFE